MEPYGNLAGNSGVLAFECAPGSITVQFKDGSVYLYTDASAGAEAVTEMRRLARRGRGLTGFINRAVREKHARKLN